MGLNSMALITGFTASIIGSFILTFSLDIHIMLKIGLFVNVDIKIMQIEMPVLILANEV